MRRGGGHPSYIEERHEFTEKEAAWKAGLSCCEVSQFFSTAVLTLKPQTISARCSCLHAVLAVYELVDVA
jgi:hypothetical protein